MTTSHFQLSNIVAQNQLNSTLLLATVWIINNIYADHTKSLTISRWSRTAVDDRIQTQLLTDILTSVDEAQLTYVIENSDDIQCDGIFHQCKLGKNVIIMVDSFEAFMLFKRNLVKRNYLTAGFYSILYTGKSPYYYDMIGRIFHELFAIYVTNVNVYIELADETLVYSYFPFTQYQCHASSPILHNRFTTEDGYVYLKQFFPRKTDNLYGCVVTVATWYGPPFVFFRKNADGELMIRGIEGALIRMLAFKMNFTIKVLVAESRGIVYSNLTATTGAVKLIIDGKANITINSFIYSEYLQNAMLATYTYTSYPIIIAVPRGSSLNSFQRLTRPFKYIIWSCLSSSILAGITIIFIIKCLQKKTISDFVFGPLNATPFTNLLNTLLGGQATVLPQRNFARYILLVWLMYTLVVRSAYTGELFIMLQDSTARNDLKTIKEVVHRNFTLMGTENTLDMIKRWTQAHRIESIKGQPLRYLEELHDSKSHLAVVVLRPFLRAYNRITFGKPPIRALPDSLVTVPLTMYLRKNSYLLEIVNEYLLKFVASGLIEIWNDFYLPREDVMQDEVDGEPAVLSVKLLIGLFSIYLFFMGICILVFSLEMWSRYSPICRCVLDFCNY